MDMVSYLPHLQAGLNALTATLLATGYYFIRKQHHAAHRACMIGAAVVSAIFMICYLIYHANIGNIPFAGQGTIRPFYFTILVSHVTLAAINIPLVIMTLIYAARARFVNHRRLARWALPIWFYVSVTGLLIYLLAFHLYTGV